MPERGPIGANCLANPRDFLTPVAAYEDRDAPSKMYVKWGGSMWCTAPGPFAVGRRRLARQLRPVQVRPAPLSPVGPLLFDHADPSIFTVLTAPSETPGTANVDFVVFPDRWMVAEDTFRPPWYHMNIMSEFMGLIYGVYDAKPQGFVPGGFSLHNCMLPHGPGRRGLRGGQHRRPETGSSYEGTMAFMFETRFPQRVTTLRRGTARAAGRLRRLLAGAGEAVHRPAHCPRPPRPDRPGRCHVRRAAANR